MNEALLSHLTDSQIAFSYTFLEDVFLHQKTNLSYVKPDDLNAICALIKTVPSKTMKHSLFTALDTPVQIQIAQKLDDTELNLLFSYHDDLAILKLIFQSLPEPRKESVIQILFQSDKTKFNELKPFMTSVNNKPEKSEALSPQDLTRLIQSEVKTLLTFIVKPEYSVAALKEHISEAERKIQIDHFELISRHVINQFMRLNVPLSNKENFAAHVKFYTFLEPYLIMFPKLNVVVLHPLDMFLTALNRLPNGIWVIKVLSQLPHTILGLCLDRLKSHPRIPELQKRTIYSKLLSIIYENVHIQEGVQIRALLEG